MNVTESGNVSTTNIVVTKILCAVVLGGCSILAGVLPIGISLLLDSNKYDSEDDKEKIRRRKERVVSLMMSFAGGVLLCTVFIHLLPEVSEMFEDMRHSNSQWSEYFPEFMPQALLCVGFFIMFFVEEIANALIRSKNHFGHSHDVNIEPIDPKTGISIIKTIGENADEANSIFCRNVINITRESAKHLSSTESQRIMNYIFTALDDNYRTQLNENFDTCCPIREMELKEKSLIDEENDFSPEKARSSIRSFLLALALSVHALFEGMAIGLEQHTAFVWLMLLGVGAHKVVLSACMGIEMVAANTKRCIHISYLFMFAIVSPLGIGAGLLLSREESAASAIFQGLASGTLLYVLFFEVLKYQRHSSGFQSFLAVLLGFLVMAGLQWLADD